MITTTAATATGGATHMAPVLLSSASWFAEVAPITHWSADVDEVPVWLEAGWTSLGVSHFSGEVTMATRLFVVDADDARPSPLLGLRDRYREVLARLDRTSTEGSAEALAAEIDDLWEHRAAASADLLEP